MNKSMTNGSSCGGKRKDSKKAPAYKAGGMAFTPCDSCPSPAKCAAKGKCAKQGMGAGKPKAYKAGGKVRGAGKAQRGVRPCKMM